MTEICEQFLTPFRLVKDDFFGEDVVCENFTVLIIIKTTPSVKVILFMLCIQKSMSHDVQYFVLNWVVKLSSYQERKIGKFWTTSVS